jgi:hypothetical protein
MIIVATLHIEARGSSTEEQRQRCAVIFRIEYWKGAAIDSSNAFEKHSHSLEGSECIWTGVLEVLDWITYCVRICPRYGDLGFENGMSQNNVENLALSKWHAALFAAPRPKHGLKHQPACEPPPRKQRYSLLSVMIADASSDYVRLARAYRWLLGLGLVLLRSNDTKHATCGCVTRTKISILRRVCTGAVSRARGFTAHFPFNDNPS